jgi:Fur family transcriptional regulator, ferric uptake regulator
MAWVENVLTHLSTQGHRVTEPRRAIMERIVRYTQPFGTEQLYQDLGGEGGSIGRATVYRTVELLLAMNWLARVHWNSKQLASDDHAYVPVEQGHQHQLVCRSCGSVATFEGCEIETLLGGLARRLHFRVEGHWLEIFGLCQSCQRQASFTVS